MPEVELHADYDCDGVLSRGPREYRLRFLDPGAIIPIDVDRDGRALPDVPRAEGAVKLDCELGRIEAVDDEPLRLQLVVSERAVELLAEISLRVEGACAATLALYDGRFMAVERRAGSNDFALSLEAGRHELRLLARLPPGSPLGPVIDDARTGGAVRLAIVARTIAGAEFEIDSGLFQLARYIAGNDFDVAECVYMARHGDGEPAVSDVAEAIAQADPPVVLRVVDEIESRGDAWLRDQFQAGHFVTPSGTMRAILHLPRMRVNAVLGKSVENLAAMVRSHFPSTGVGLIDDFWRRTFSVRHSGGEASLSVAAAQELHRKLAWIGKAYEIGRTVFSLLCEAARSLSIADLPPGCGEYYWSARRIDEQRTDLDLLLAPAEALLREIRASSPRASESLSRRVAAWERTVRSALDGVRIRPDDGFFRVVAGRRELALDADQLQAAWEAIAPAFDALVYGGNFVVSPPQPSHPLGRVLAGHSPRERPLDPQLVDFLEANAAIQPWVAVDTAWLTVGHVDELLAFLPDAAQGGHAMLRASPHAAMVILRKAQEMGGATRLLRGRLWLEDCAVPLTEFQREAARTVAGMFGTQRMHEALEELTLPPRIAQLRMDSFEPRFEPDHVFIYSRMCPRYHPAALSVDELLRFEGGTQDEVHRRMEPLDELLAGEFGDFRQLPLPAVFDYPAGSTTAAFMPHLVNLLYVNGIVLVPAPCGPRMKPDDAAEVVKHALRETGLERLAGQVTAAALRRQGLDEFAIWLRRDLRTNTGARYDGPFAMLEAIAGEFADGFPGTEPAQIERLIRESNRGAFERSGRLKPEWRKLRIPEGTVDLFEAYAHTVVSSLGLRVRFVDCWYYHVRYGGLHCGTNALRRAPTTAKPWWSRVAAPPRG